MWWRCTMLMLSLFVMGYWTRAARGEETIEDLEAQAKQALRRLVAEVKNDKKGLLDPQVEDRDRETRVLAAEALERVIEDFKKELQQTVAKPEKVNRLSREGLGLRLMHAMQLTDEEIRMLIENLGVPTSAVGVGADDFHFHPFAIPLPRGAFISPLMERYLTTPAEVVADTEIRLATYMLKSAFDNKPDVPLAIIRKAKAGPRYPRNPKNIDRLEAELSK